MAAVPSNYDFQPYGAGAKRYGAGRDAPNIGPSDPMGYKERELRSRARSNAIMRRLKATQAGNYMSPGFLGGSGGV